MHYANSPSHILLVEDSQVDLDRIERAIRKADPTVHLDLARDGQQAIAYLKQWETDAPPPILILLDLRHTHPDGLQLLQTIKTSPISRIIPVVILSNSTENDNIEQAYKLGANSYIIKSSDYDQLGETVGLIYRYWCKLNVRP